MSVGSYQRGASNNSSTGTNNNNNNNCDVSINTSSVRLAGDNTKDRMYEPKHHQKAVRVLTVVAYIFFVSLAAIMLSLYYVFLYNPPPPQPSYNMSASPNDNECRTNRGMNNQTTQTPALETPRVLSVKNHNVNEIYEIETNSISTSTTEMNNVDLYNSSNITQPENNKKKKKLTVIKID
ncbi:trp-interacting inaF-D [Lycorma delicatula]|uniref:trp-interacting inaF-D n=1 Tax=Lycorma delicatula TaxID=130591 RepID=UPI003F51866E